MNPAFTTVLAVDLQHLEELKLVWPTWTLHRPEIVNSPIVVFTDCCVPDEFWRSELAFLPPRAKRVSWPVPGSLKFETHREKMLASFIAAPRYVETEWFLKLDTDAVAMRGCEWLDPAWFKDSVFVASPWSYTKPAEWIDQLDQWGDKVPGLAECPRLNLHPLPGWRRLMHRRIISFVYFGRTDWHCELADLCGNQLPVPSQDTIAWYVATRRRAPFRIESMKHHGWAHVRPRRLAAVCEEAMGNP